MKHLVLGSSGQIGYHLVNRLRDRGYEIDTFDIVDNCGQDLRICNNTILEDKINNADFIHFLAFDIGGSLYMKKYQDTFDFISNNIKIMNNTFDVIKKYDKPFIFASSQMSNMLHSTYGILKAIGERYTRSMNGLIVKFWNVYGYEKDDDKSHVITDFIKMAKNSGVIKMRTSGTEVRQFLYGDDCADCLIDLSNAYKEIDRNEQLHITSFEWTSILQIAEIIKDLYPNIEIFPSDQIDQVQLDSRNQPDESILKYWKPKTKLQDGIQFINNLI